MTTRLSVVCAGATAMSRIGGFAAPSEPLDAAGAAAAARMRWPRTAASVVMAGPGEAARQTARAIGGDPHVVPALADMDWGAWSGATFATVQAVAPERLMAWMGAPAGGAPGGEDFAAVVARVVPWLDAIAHGERAVIAVTQAMVVRAILTAAIALPPEVALRIDIAPLATASLSFHRGWRWQELRRGGGSGDR
ncbi:histidine phosphatase family protein [Sphingomonas adhaesiva]|uniref:histidine phosphatase family protein n=1 Tax=Sphingomonas adhaesiva TaxID=28212 RepID=UPI002FF6A43A